MYGFIRHRIRPAANREVVVSGFRSRTLPKRIKLAIIAARFTEGVKFETDINNIKRGKGTAERSRRGSLLKISSIKLQRKPMCKPDTAAICINPEPDI